MVAELETSSPGTWSWHAVDVGTSCDNGERYPCQDLSSHQQNVFSSPPADKEKQPANLVRLKSDALTFKKINGFEAHLNASFEFVFCIR